MFMGESKKESMTNGELVNILKNYPDNAIILFQDLSFNSSQKQPINDIVIREEEYINHKNKKTKAIILLNEDLKGI